MSDQVAQYVVSCRPAAARGASAEPAPAEPAPAARVVDALGDALGEAAGGVRVLGELDASTALVEMSEDAAARVRDGAPHLAVEPNAPYTRRGA